MNELAFIQVLALRLSAMVLIQAAIVMQNWLVRKHDVMDATTVGYTTDKAT